MTDAIIASIDSIRSRASTQETLLTLAVPVEHSATIAPFLAMIGQQIGVAFADLSKASVSSATETEPVEREPVVAGTKGNQLARDMHVNGYFRNPKLWAAMALSGLYKQSYHKAWIESQPCAGRKRAPGIACGGDVCAHHARDSSNSGTGIKPDDWFTAPMCNNHHQQWAHGSNSLSITREEGVELVTAAVTLTAERMKIAMKEHMGIESLSDPMFTEAVLEKFEREIGL